MKIFLRMIAAFTALLSCIAPGYASVGSLEPYRTELRDSILSNIHGARIPTNTIDITRFGAKGDGVTDCLPAFKKAFKKIAKAGGGRINIPSGIYLLRGPLHLVSDLCVNLEEGAVLKFDPDPTLYPPVNTGWEGTYLYNCSPFIYGYGLHDVAITGEGLIDGNAMTTFATWRPLQKEAQRRSRDMNHAEVPIDQRRFTAADHLRPQLIQLYRCKGVTLDGIKIINSPFWCIHLLQSEDIICRGLRYDAKLINNDGIDPESSRNILIEGIEFDNGDDNIAIKSGRDNDGWICGMPSENIVIRDCHFKGLHAVVIGSEMSGGVRNIIIENCDYAGYCKRGIYVKTNPDRGGYVKGIYVNDCTFGDVEDLFYVTSRYAGEGLESTNFSEISDIHVNGLKCATVSAAALVIQGTEVRPVTNVSFDNVEVGSAVTAISFDNVEDVRMGTCHIGPRTGVPTQVTAKDRLFERDKSPE